MVIKEPITRKGYDILKDELVHLQSQERPAIIEAIAEARAHGDLKENHEYHSAREKQSFIEGRIEDLNDIIAHSDIIDVEHMTGGDTVKFGALVKSLVRHKNITADNKNPEDDELLNDSDFDDDEEEVFYRLVGRHEANVSKGLLSIRAPMAHAIINKKVGDKVIFRTPKVIKQLTVLSIEFDLIK